MLESNWPNKRTKCITRHCIGRLASIARSSRHWQAAAELGVRQHMFRHLLIKFLRPLVICQHAIWVVPISLAWIVGAFSFIYLPLISWLKKDIELPSFYWLVGMPWMLACGSGLWFLWDLFFCYRKYAIVGVPKRVKAGILLGFIPLFPAVIHELANTTSNSEQRWGILLFYGVPACLLYQFHLLIALGKRPTISVERDASPHNG
jgi:hypothetical protein